MSNSLKDKDVLKLLLKNGYMFYTYPAIVHEGKHGGYWAEFVDFNAFTQGDSLNELISNAEEAMACHIEDELKKGTLLPTPSDIRQIRTENGSFATLVHVAISETTHPLTPAAVVS